jgi:flagellar basal-body rod protein FlgB
MNSILGIHESALLFRAQRMDVLAANLANADTPHYKARDVEFGRAMDTFGKGASIRRTHRQHIAPGTNLSSAAMQYRIPHQPSLDGNTVEADLELARFAENAVAYQASLLFLNGRISTLRAAITGGR